MEIDPVIPKNIPCMECQVGVMRKRHLTYFTWLGDELVTVPNFPAWVCDVCGKREYDQQAEMWLHTLLKPEAGKTTMKSRKQRQKIQRPPLPPITDRKG
jgi:YgiT-type zinc finger domain-containing protein